MRLQTYLDEGKVVSLLSRKIKMLKQKHGYVSKSMLTKQEWEQFQKERK